MSAREPSTCGNRAAYRNRAARSNRTVCRHPSTCGNRAVRAFILARSQPRALARPHAFPFPFPRSRARLFCIGRVRGLGRIALNETRRSRHRLRRSPGLS